MAAFAISLGSELNWMSTYHSELEQFCAGLNSTNPPFKVSVHDTKLLLTSISDFSYEVNDLAWSFSFYLGQNCGFDCSRNAFFKITDCSSMFSFLLLLRSSSSSLGIGTACQGWTEHSSSKAKYKTPTVGILPPASVLLCCNHTFELLWGQGLQIPYRCLCWQEFRSSLCLCSSWPDCLKAVLTTTDFAPFPNVWKHDCFPHHCWQRSFFGFWRQLASPEWPEKLLSHHSLDGARKGCLSFPVISKVWTGRGQHSVCEVPQYLSV